MKKALSVFLAAIIMISALSLMQGAFAVSEKAGIAVASDLHYNIPRETLEGEIDDEIFFYANRRAAMEDESGFIIDEFLSQCAEDDSVEYVFISGDLADNGRRLEQEHLDVAEKLRKFESETGKPVYVVNGNHDTGAGKEEITNEKFREIYNEFGYGEALETQDGTLSYTANIGEKYRLIAADSCDPTVSTEDGLTSDRVNWAVKQAKQAYDDGRYPILMMHHNLLDHMPMQRVVSRNFIVRFHRTTAELFADWGVRVVISGHEHCGDATAFTSALGNKIYDFAVTSLTMYPLSYLTLSFADDAIRYDSVPVERIDTDALTLLRLELGEEGRP